jgi:cytidylate kinase
MIITLDGPMASGKSSVARAVAHELGYYFLSTGLLYRGLAYLLVDRYGYDEQKLLAPDIVDVERCFAPEDFAYCYDALKGERYIFNGVDITESLKNKMIDHYASLVSIHPQVRSMLTVVQRTIAVHHNVVIEGRDSGSVVFPYAEYKFFLTASPTVRAQRWLQDQRAQGVFLPLGQALQELTKRDERDKNRAIAPLIIPEGALVIDSSDLIKQAVVAQIIASVQARVLNAHTPKIQFLEK